MSTPNHEGTHAQNTARDRPYAVPDRNPTDAEWAEDWARELVSSLPVSATTAERMMAAQTFAALAQSFRLTELTRAIEDGTAQLIYLRHAVEGLGVVGVALTGTSA